MEKVLLFSHGHIECGLCFLQLLSCIQNFREGRKVEIKKIKQQENGITNLVSTILEHRAHVLRVQLTLYIFKMKYQKKVIQWLSGMKSFTLTKGLPLKVGAPFSFLY